MRKIAMLSTLTAAALAFGCDTKAAPESSAEKAAEKTEEAAEKAAEKTEEAAEKAAEKVEDAAEEPKAEPEEGGW